MKIGYLMPEWPGQTHVWTWREISHLRDTGLEVALISTRQPQELGKHPFVPQAQAETYYLWPQNVVTLILSLGWVLFRCPRGLLACLRLCFTLPIDKQPAWKHLLPLILPACSLAHKASQERIEHLHTPIPGNSAVLCMMVKRLLNIPFSLTVVAAFDAWGGAVREKMEDASFITLVATWMVDQMRKDFPSISPNRYSITRHGVDTQKWVPRVKDRFRHAHPQQILSVGRLVYNKGFDTLLHAVALLKSQGHSFHLKIAGEGPERHNLEGLIDALDLKSEVTLLGSIGEDECLQLMQSSDLFVLASHKEPLGVVYLEAMATEVATIGTAAGGVVEIINHGVNGLLVPPHAPDRLADAMMQILTDAQLRDRLAKAGRQTVVEKFDSRLGAAKLSKLLYRSKMQDYQTVTLPLSEAML
jgi:colanic acid/amylovoran biosynthesis glycosyltransferase